MKVIDNFTKQYNVSKTLKCRLIPIGKTMENFQLNERLDKETNLNESVSNVKKYIMECLCNENDYLLSQPNQLSHLHEYSELYYDEERDNNKLQKCEEELRKEIVSFLSPIKKKLKMRKEFLTEFLPNVIGDDSKKEEILALSNYTTFFGDYLTNCDNMYSSEESSTAIANRCIGDNLPKFMDNMTIYENVISNLPSEYVNALRENFVGIYNVNIDDMFTLDYYNCVLSQSGIDSYNMLIGGYVDESGSKIRGINEYISMHNAQKNGIRIPLMKALYKQIGSHNDVKSFLPLSFKDDKELLDAVYNYFNLDSEKDNVCSYFNAIKNISAIIANIKNYELDKIYVSNNVNIRNLSGGMLGKWNSFEQLWNKKYDDEKKPKKVKSIEKYEDKRKKEFKKVQSFSLNELQELIINYNDNHNHIPSVIDYYINKLQTLIGKVNHCYAKSKETLTIANKKLLKCDDNRIAKIKNLLDSVKDIEKFLRILQGTGKESTKDELFYGDYYENFNHIKAVDPLYNKVRNYITSKPYSKNKIKLSFDNPQFLEGWQNSLESQRSSQLFMKDGMYYLGVMDKNSRKEFKKPYNLPVDKDDKFTKIEYSQIAQPGKQIQNLMVIDGKTVKKNGKRNEEGINEVLEELKNTYLPADINKIRKKGSYKTTSKDFNQTDLIMYLEYYIERVREYYSQYNFEFKKATEYHSFVEFVDDVNRQAYQINMRDVSYKQVMQLVDEGKLYLFQLYNKDFSPHSKGKKDLHTLYFQMLFDKRNLTDVVYKLLGGAEMFYRPASIRKEDRVIHPKNQEIRKRTKEEYVAAKGGKGNLTPEERKQCFSLYKYDIIKNKRFTEGQFFLHFAISLNCQEADYKFLNYEVRNLLKTSNKTNIIGINRGERNLIYVTVIDSEGNIKEQENFNIITHSYNGLTYNVNYQDKLDKKEKNREQARENWTTLESIKELKEGYLSQVIYKICKLIVKYDAIVVMENLNSKFKNSRVRIEKQIYQKFENMLINKLNYYVDKDTDIDKCGGLLNAYQLTNKADTTTSSGSQNGIIFFVNPGYITNVDPTTGFISMINPKYENIKQVHSFIENIDDIRYNKDKDYFEFDIDFKKFPVKFQGGQSEWTVCTFGERLKYINNPLPGQKSYETLSMTSEFKELFDDCHIKYEDGNVKDSLLCIDSKPLLQRFMELLKLTLQISNVVYDRDYIISPVLNNNNEFYCSKSYITDTNANIPCCVDSNGSYNLARKGLIFLNRIKEAKDVTEVSTYISNEEWLDYIQNN